MTIFGSDVSHYDASDTRAMFAEGIVFQTHKAGGDKDDPELNAWWNYVKGYRRSVLLGAYWVLYPGRPTQRADAFISRLNAQCPGWQDGPFILEADCEMWNGDPATVPPISDVNAFGDRLRERMPKLMPIAYLPDWVYGDISALRYPLWSSKYVTGSGPFEALYPGDSARQWAAYGGKTPALLQYSSHAVIGGQTTSDADAYRGTSAELIKLLAPGWTEGLVATLDKDDKKYLETTIGPRTDVVPRWTEQGTRVPDDDSNPKMQVSEGIFYTGAGVRRVENAVLAMSGALNHVLVNVLADDGDKAELLAAIEAAKQQTIAGVLDELSAAGRDMGNVAAALVAAFGPGGAQALVTEIGKLLPTADS